MTWDRQRWLSTLWGKKASSQVLSRCLHIIKQKRLSLCLSSLHNSVLQWMCWIWGSNDSLNVGKHVNGTERQSETLGAIWLTKCLKELHQQLLLPSVDSCIPREPLVWCCFYDFIVLLYIVLTCFPVRSRKYFVCSPKRVSKHIFPSLKKPNAIVWVTFCTKTFMSSPLRLVHNQYGTWMLAECP